MKRSPENDAAAAEAFVEDVEISGHIIDSLILPKVLDCISAAGETFRIKTISIGQARNDASYGLVEVRAESSEQLAVLGTIADHGAIPTVKQDCHLIAADMNGAFPEGFTARRINGPRFGCVANGWTSPRRRWTAGSSSTRQW